jgi:hypothetical protein
MEFQKQFIEELKKVNGDYLNYNDYLDYKSKYRKLYRENDPNAPKKGFVTLTHYDEKITRKFVDLLKEYGIEREK